MKEFYKVKKTDFEKDFKYFQDNKRTFTRRYTKYSELLKFDWYKTRYNDNGEPDGELLHIINLVKKDAEKYLKKEGVKNTFEIGWTTLKGIPEQKDFYKIDINSAYWEAALKRGVISQRTNLKALEYAQGLKRNENETDEDYEKRKVKRFKQIRLKSIGSLATKVCEENYINGQLVPQLVNGKEILTKVTQDKGKLNLYYQICEDIDVLIKLILRAVPQAWFQYWDCIFCMPDGVQETVRLLREAGFDATQDLAHFEVIPLSDYRIQIETKMYSDGEEKTYNVKPNIHTKYDY